MMLPQVYTLWAAGIIVLPDDKSIHALGIGASRFEVSGGQHYSSLPLPLSKLWWS
jgi:hypothetical protein